MAEREQFLAPHGCSVLPTTGYESSFVAIAICEPDAWSVQSAMCEEWWWLLLVRGASKRQFYRKIEEKSLRAISTRCTKWNALDDGSKQKALTMQQQTQREHDKKCIHQIGMVPVQLHSVCSVHCQRFMNGCHFVLFPHFSHKNSLRWGKSKHLFTRHSIEDWNMKSCCLRAKTKTKKK